jgi:hypothetical protein
MEALEAGENKDLARARGTQGTGQKQGLPGMFWPWWRLANKTTGAHWENIPLRGD